MFKRYSFTSLCRKHSLCNHSDSIFNRTIRSLAKFLGSLKMLPTIDSLQRWDLLMTMRYDFLGQTPMPPLATAERQDGSLAGLNKWACSTFGNVMLHRMCEFHIEIRVLDNALVTVVHCTSAMEPRRLSAAAR